MRDTLPQAEPMTEDDLVGLLLDELRDSSTYQSELADQQAENMRRYLAQPYNDGSERPNRSSVVTHDVEDTINWMMPHLLRAFADRDDLIACDDEALEDDDEPLKDAAAYLRHVLFKDNSGIRFIHDSLFDGLLQKIGAARVYWEDPEPSPPRIMTGLLPDQLMKIVSDPRYQILKASVDGELPPDEDADDAEDKGEEDDADEPGMAGGQPQPQMPPQGAQPMPGGPQGMLAPQPQAPLPAMFAGAMSPGQVPQPQQPPQPEVTYTIEVVFTPAVGRVRMDVVPPEELRVTRRARDLNKGTYTYHGWQYEAWAGDLAKDHPDKAWEITDGKASDTVDDAYMQSDPRYAERFDFDEQRGVAPTGEMGLRRRVIVNIEYIRCDFDGDGTVELRRVKRVGKVILENDEVDETEFVTWSPIPIPHRLIGRAAVDPILDIARIRTALTRRAMDSLSQALQPRTAVSKRAIGDDDTVIDRLTDHEVGDVIELEAEDLTKAILPLTTPDVSPMAFQALEYWDRRQEEASGVNRHAQGISPDAITQTKGGIENLQAAANSRIELIARWYAEFLQSALGKALRLIVRNQDQARFVRLNGRRMAFDPRRWSEDMTVSVHVAGVGDSPEKKLVGITAIANDQKEILLQLGPSNPLCSLKQYAHTLKMKVELLGYRNTNAFFGDVPDNWQPAQPPEDPKIAIEREKLQHQAQQAQQKAQTDAQLRQMELQASSAIEQQKMQATSQREAEIAAREEARATRDAIDKMTLERERMAQEQDLAIAKMDGEARLARQKMAAEMALARWQTMMQLRVTREGHAAAAHQSRMAADAKATLSTDRPGGRLDA